MQNISCVSFRKNCLPLLCKCKCARHVVKCGNTYCVEYTECMESMKLIYCTYGRHTACKKKALDKEDNSPFWKIEVLSA